MSLPKKLKRANLKFLKLRKIVLNYFMQLLGGMQRAEHILMVVAAVVIGIVSAFCAILFRWVIMEVHFAFYQTQTNSLEWLSHLAWWKILLLPTLGGLIVGPIIHYLAKEVQSSGVPEVMEAVAIRGGKIRPRVILSKMLAAAVTIGSGGSVGREGPIIQISSAIGSAFGQFLTVTAARLRTFVACGAAAGIAATFNAPIAGALFAVEVIIGNFGVTQFSPIVISSVVATVISRHFIGDVPAFIIPDYQVVSSYEFIPYSILGVLAGLTAVLMITVLFRTKDLFDKISIPLFLKPAIGGFLTGLIALVFPQILGVGYESVSNALLGQNISWFLALLIFAKIIATSFTLASGGSGGIFAPSLFIGAMLGSLVGLQANMLYPDLTAGTGAYALVGMGALVAGTTHAPISAILIIFELTNDYKIIAPLMISCIISVLLATYFKPESVYTLKLVRRGIKIFEGRDVNILRGIKVANVVNQDVEIIDGNCSFTDVVHCMIRSQHNEYFVVDPKKQLIGTISITDLKQFLRDEEYLSGLVIASDIAHSPRATLYLEDNLDLVMHSFGRYNVDELPVLKSKEDHQLVGSIQRKEVIEAYNKEIFKWDLAGGMHSVVTAVNKNRMVELTKGYSLTELEPPNHFVGKSLKQLNIRARYGIEVILIKKSQSDEDCNMPERQGEMPKPNYMIQPGDKLLVLGDTKSIKYLMN